MKAKEAGQHSPSEPDARQRITAVAEELFAERGFAGTSMQTIADAAGVNKAMLYYYFRDKRDLYSSVIRVALDTLAGTVDEIAAQCTSAREKVAEFARRSYLDMSESPGAVRIIQRELMGFGERGNVGVGEGIQRQVARLEPIIRDGIEKGEFRPVDPALAVRSLLGMLHVFIMESVLTGQARPAEKTIKHTVELFCRGIAR